MHLVLLQLSLGEGGAVLPGELHEYVVLLGFGVPCPVLLFLDPVLRFPYLLQLIQLFIFVLGFVGLEEVAVLEVFLLDLGLYLGQVPLEHLDGVLQVLLILTVGLAQQLLLVVTESANEVDLDVGEVHAAELALFHALSELLMNQLVYLVCVQLEYPFYLIFFELDAFLGNGRGAAGLAGLEHVFELELRGFLVGDQTDLELAGGLAGLEHELVASLDFGKLVLLAGLLLDADDLGEAVGAGVADAGEGASD